jgi:hypothetical protein
MGEHYWRRSLGGMVPLFVATYMSAACGCTVTIQPWTKPGEKAPAAVAAPTTAPTNDGPFPPGILPTSLRQQGLHVNPQAPYNVPPMPNVANESVVQLYQKMAEADENRRAMQDQVQTLRRSLKDREDNVRQASYEMEESSKQLKRTRDDFRQWQSDMDELRERVRKLEDGRAALRPLIEDILRQLERDRDAFKLTVPVQSHR